MSQNRMLRRAFPAFIALAALLLAGLPAQAKTARSATRSFAASGENHLARLWSYVASLWSLTKEGMTIDPDGKNHATAVLPGGDGDDAGMMIDPDGRL